MKNYLMDRDYDFIFSKVPRLCVDLIIKKESRILLSYRNINPQKNKWHLPGGMVYRDELLEKAVLRIAKKETGLSVAIESMVGYMEFLKEVQDGKIRHSVSIVFLVKSGIAAAVGDFQSKKLCYFNEMPCEMHTVHGKFLIENKIF